MRRFSPLSFLPVSSTSTATATRFRVAHSILPNVLLVSSSCSSSTKTKSDKEKTPKKSEGKSVAAKTLLLPLAKVKEAANVFARLSQLTTTKVNSRDHFRAIAFKKASEKLNLLHQQRSSKGNDDDDGANIDVMQVKDFLSLPDESTVWQRFSKWLEQGHLEELDTLECDPCTQTAEFVGTVLGFGDIAAKAMGKLVQQKLVNKGEPITDLATFKKTLAQLEKQTGASSSGGDDVVAADNAAARTLLLESKKSFFPLTKTQLLGLEHHADMQHRIPRSEIATGHEPLLKKAAARIGYNFMICGSYRREKPTCGDIDCIIWKKKGNDTKIKRKSNDKKNNATTQQQEEPSLSGFIAELNRLTKNQYIVSTFALGTTKYMGLCRLPTTQAEEKKSDKKKKNKNDNKNRVRRIDIRLVPEEYVPTTTLYFTGSALHNVKMRNIAQEKNMCLNEYGLYETSGSEQMIPVSSERDVFKILGMKYVEPKDRE